MAAAPVDDGTRFAVLGAARPAVLFGSLAEVCADNPGTFLGTDEAREEGALDPTDLATLEQALTELSYMRAPEELLESDYKDPSKLEHFAARPTWWTRFFGSM